MSDAILVFDRNFEISEDSHLEAFIADPKAFLEEIGALRDLPAFNGLVDENGPIDPTTFLKNWRSARQKGSARMSCRHVYGPVPRFCEWFCVIY
jgi:hypothetical protein